MKNVNLIFPNQLFEASPLFEKEGDYILIEEHLFFRQFHFHQQKIAFHRASMKSYAHFLEIHEKKISYVDAHEPNADIRILIRDLAQSGVGSITIIDPVDNWLRRRIITTCAQFSIELKVLDSPMFLNKHEELKTFFHPTKIKFFQTEFYKKERKKRDVLLTDSGDPQGGQWTYDVENRKKYPKGKTVVQTDFPAGNPFYLEAVHYTRKYFGTHPGLLFENAKHYPIDFEESKEWFATFLTQRFTDFGIYEDAIVSNELVLHHSVITPMLNSGLLTPQYILDQTIEFSRTHEIPLNSLEGFIRQIMGWREFIRGVYVTKGSQERTTNYWGFTRKIPPSFYTGTTGIEPIDLTIKKVLETGYCHHIERLMVLGNFMLLCEFDPDEVYRWFMELFIDAYDWVMVPNVYGMSQFADGGIMSTKPYISGSNYLMKMSDYPKGEWQSTWDALFWRFMDIHRDFFLQNPRLGMLISTFDKWSEEKKQEVRTKANDYLIMLDRALKD
jgi:deoxyribodipyrimidine photolyase-related protein